MSVETVLQELTAQYAALPQVLAVVQGGSRTAGNGDELSDVDLYVYSREGVPVELRRAIAQPRAQRLELDNHFAEDGDEWIERDSGLAVDVMFRRASSFEDHLTWLLEKDEAHQGYSTAVWHNLRTSRVLFDREGWFGRLQARALVPYPDSLAQAIIALNMPRLRGMINTRSAEIARAAVRNDIVAVSGAVNKLVDSYFDVLFALNRVPHPGEKRLLRLASALPLVPEHFAEDIEALLSFTATSLDEVSGRAERVVDGLVNLLRQHGQLPAPWGEVL